MKFILMLISLALLRYLNTVGLAEKPDAVKRNAAILPEGELRFNGKI
jgi:hypothetical protein